MSEIDRINNDLVVDDLVYRPSSVVNIKDNPQYAPRYEEWENLRKIQKIKFDVGDECVFEITKGDKKWTISLDDFFDKVIQICGEKKDVNKS